MHGRRLGDAGLVECGPKGALDAAIRDRPTRPLRCRTTRTRGGHHRISELEIQRLLTTQDKKPGSSVPSAALGKSAPSAAGVLVALSGRNQLRGVVEEVRSDGLLSQVRLRIGNQILTAVITRDAVNELKLKRGDEAVAIIKSTEVMIGRMSTDRHPKR